MEEVGRRIGRIDENFTLRVRDYSIGESVEKTEKHKQK
jgi:hypothetical protein